MNDYISRQTAMDCLTGIYEDPVSLHEYIATTLKKLRNAPSADVQPVVRCKDCNDYQTKFRWCKLHDGEMQPTDFCSYGEQRGGEQNDVSDTNVGDTISRQAAIDAAVELAEARRRWETSEGQAEIRGIDAFMCAIEDLPSADVQPVRHGHWIEHVCELFPAEGTVECSECHEHESIFLVNDKYCPNCGAKMDGEQND